VTSLSSLESNAVSNDSTTEPLRTGELFTGLLLDDLRGEEEVELLVDVFLETMDESLAEMLLNFSGDPARDDLVEDEPEPVVAVYLSGLAPLPDIVEDV
jgi:hypothetical protein